MVFCYLTIILIICLASPFVEFIADAVASCPIAVDTRLYLDGSTSLTLVVGLA